MTPVGIYQPLLRSTLQGKVSRITGFTLMICLTDAMDNPLMPKLETLGDSTVSLGQPIFLTGAGSHDPDCDDIEKELSFDWALDSKPAGSAAEIAQDPESPETASLRPDVIGDYTVRLTVSNSNESQVATTTISVADLTFDGGGDGSDWFDPDNWNFQRVPDLDDDVLIPETFQVAFAPSPSASHTVRNLTLKGELAISDGQLFVNEVLSVAETTGVLSVVDVGTLGLGAAAELQVDGHFEFSGTNTTQFSTDASDIIRIGTTGTVTLNNTTLNNLVQILGALFNDGTLEAAPGLTVLLYGGGESAGHFAAGEADLVLRGTHTFELGSTVNAVDLTANVNGPPTHVNVLGSVEVTGTTLLEFGATATFDPDGAFDLGEVFRLRQGTSATLHAAPDPAPAEVRIENGSELALADGIDFLIVPRPGGSKLQADFEIIGGALRGSGSETVTVGDVSVPGTVLARLGFTDITTLDGVTLTSFGDVEWQNGDINGGNGAVLDLQGTTLFIFSGQDVCLDGDATGGPITTIMGDIEKKAGADPGTTATLRVEHVGNPPVVNNGTLLIGPTEVCP